jgi:hypothetical protein
MEGAVSESSLACLLDIQGVVGYGYETGGHRLSVSYDAALITPAKLDEEIRSAGFAATPED